MNKTSKIYVAGHNGLVGSAIIRKLQSDGYSNILTCSKNTLDLRKRFSPNGHYRKLQRDRDKNV